MKEIEKGPMSFLPKAYTRNEIIHLESFVRKKNGSSYRKT
jgi:hypothetical protein